MLGAVLLAMVGFCCASAPPPVPKTPADVIKGSASIKVAAPRVVRVRQPWQVDVLLLGAPTSYPDSMYILAVSTETGQTLFSVSPAIQRYYTLPMAPFHNSFYPRDGVQVYYFSLHKIRGFSIFGEVELGPVWLSDSAVVRYTYSLEARR